MSLYSELAEHGPRGWSGQRGEVPSIFVTAVEAAREHLAAEKDDDLRPFWEWRLAVAEGQLRDAEERAKEERGE